MPKTNCLSIEFAKRCEQRGEYALAAAHWQDAVRVAPIGIDRVFCESRRQRALHLARHEVRQAV